MARVHGMIKEGLYAHAVAKGAAIYLAAVLEYLTAEGIIYFLQFNGIISSIIDLQLYGL